MVMFSTVHVLLGNVIANGHSQICATQALAWQWWWWFFVIGGAAAGGDVRADGAMKLSPVQPFTATAITTATVTTCMGICLMATVGLRLPARHPTSSAASTGISQKKYSATNNGSFISRGIITTLCTLENYLEVFFKSKSMTFSRSDII